MSWNVILFKAIKPTEFGEEEDDKFVANLRALVTKKLEVKIVPVLDFEFQSLDIFFERLQRFDYFDGLILTSPRSVESIKRSTQISEESRVTWENSLKVNWASKRIFCVGPSTADCALEVLGISSSERYPNVVSSQLGTSEDLGRVIRKVSKENTSRLPLLYPCGNLKTDTLTRILTEGSVLFEPITTYATVKNPRLWSILESLSNSSKTSTGNIYVFFSPSGVKFTLPHLGQLHEKHFVAIGPTTLTSLKAVSGIDQSKVYQSSNPTPQALNQLISQIISEEVLK